jgi:hypothetical protein
MSKKEQTPSYPEDGVVFELTIDGDDPDVQPLTIVKMAGGDPGRYRYRGRVIEGKQTRRFMFVSVGGSVFEDVVARLKDKGKIPEGQWIMAVKKAFPIHGRKRPVGIVDASWREQGCGRFNGCFPCIVLRGELGFVSAHHEYLRARCWRWLVEVE